MTEGNSLEGMLLQNMALLHLVCKKIDLQGELLRTLFVHEKERRMKRKENREKQERAWALWEVGRNNPTIIQFSPKGRARFVDVFTYYRKEFLELGIKDAETLERLVHSRATRLSRSNCNWQKPPPGLP